jgi:hypothetical protein
LGRRCVPARRRPALDRPRRIAAVLWWLGPRNQAVGRRCVPATDHKPAVV